ncbi:hypothetical protein BREV_BREV_03113 [Brevundimonas mediterranea]|uniref:Uncharacterized protein n=1 Tax=Brevundimonas mediterranea TaxID=74329 RepID=A0A7Z8Y832_9CAUL|nr:hypothetical protein BREV_BREV_03113 [Brevundimonas mediterranea]
MGMDQILRIVGGPDNQAKQSSEGARGGQDEEGGARLRLGADQSGHGIGEQPAGVGKSELGGEECGPVVRRGGSPQRPARRGDRQRIAEAHDDPHREQRGIGDGKPGTCEQHGGHDCGSQDHGEAIGQSTEQPRQHDGGGHRAAAEGRQGPSRGLVGKTEARLHQDHGVDEHHGAARGGRQADGQQASQARRQGEQAHAAREALKKRSGLDVFQERQGRADHEQCRDHEAERRAGEQVVVADEGQQQGGEHRAGHALEVGGQPREGQGLGVLPLVGKQIGDHGLERRREGGRGDIEDGHQGVDLPGLADEGQRSRHDGANDIQRHQQRLSGEARRQGAGEGRHADIGDHLDGQGGAEGFPRPGARQIMGEQAERHGRHPCPQQRRDLGDEEVAITGMAEGGKHRRRPTIERRRR